MESKRVMMVCVIMGILLVQTQASFKECYEACLIVCAAEKKLGAVVCPVKCARDCIFKTPLKSVMDQTSYFCNLGCVSSRCTHLTSIQNPDAEKVEGCVNGCSKTCDEKN